MAKSLIRKNQLHPDVFDLVSGYGSDIFITSNQLTKSLSNLESGFPFQTILYTTGNQIVDGIKNFTTRPTVNNINVLLDGDSIPIIVDNVIYNTGDQNISGIKNFISRPTLNGSGLITSGETIFNGNRNITATGFHNINAGGNNLQTFLNNVFFPFTQIEIKLNNFQIQELGTIVDVLTLTGQIDLGSLNLNNISNLSPYINNQLVFPIVPNPLNTFNINIFNTNLTSTTTGIKVSVNSKDISGNNITIFSNLETLNFEAATYFGSGVSNLENNFLNMQSVLSQQNKIIQPKPLRQRLNVSTNNSYYFVYPSTWGPVNRINALYPFSDFNINVDFITGVAIFLLPNGLSHTYRYYKNSTPITLQNYIIDYYF